MTRAHGANRRAGPSGLHSMAVLAAASLLCACGGEIGAARGDHPDGGSPTDGGPPRDAGPGSDGGTVLPALHVSGNSLVDPGGSPVQLRGVNRSGTEYACIQGFGIFDGPSDDASLDAIRAWHANAIRIPLNEDCWLGLNGAAAAYSGSAYQEAIADFADRAAAKGLYPILELHWSASGTRRATGQDPMPNRDHSVAFWSDVAARFRDRGEWIFELFNEPFPDSNQDTAAAWTCWLSGGTCPGVSYQAAGMQELVTVVRSAGASNLVLLGGVQYSNSLSQWLTHLPSDPLGNLAASWHVYNFNACGNTTCYDDEVAPVAASHPVVATEIGEDDCAGTFIDPVMTWLDGHGASYLGWAWDTWGGCLVLITSYDGTPNGAYGQAYRTHLQSFP